MARGFRDEDVQREESEHVTIEDAFATGETERALQCVIGGVARWIPKSLIHDDSEVFDARDNARGKLVLPLWFVDKEGIKH